MKISTIITASVLSLFCSINAPAQAETVTATDWQQVQEQQKNNPLPTLVLLSGTDWDPISKKLMPYWKDERLISAADGMRMLHIDRLEQPDAEAIELNKRNAKFPGPIHKYPALLFFDRTNRVVGIQNGLTGEQGELLRHLTAWQQCLTRRNELLDQAKSAKGVNRARLLGQALDSMSLRLAQTNYKPIIKEIQKLDKNDETGYVFKYTFRDRGWAENIYRSQRNPKALQDFLNKLDHALTLEVIDPMQRLTVLANRYACFLLLKQEDKAVAALERLIKEAPPESKESVGAKRLLEIHQLQQKYQLAQKAFQADIKNHRAFAKLVEVIDGSPSKLQDPPLPWFERPEGRLLSMEAYMTFSNQKPYWKHQMIRQDKHQQRHQTGKMIKPWIMADLGTVRSINGVAIVFPRKMTWQVPVVIEMSQDGENWEELSRLADAQKTLQIVHCEQPQQARYVRCSRGKDEKTALYLSNFLIYGE